MMERFWGKGLGTTIVLNALLLLAACGGGGSGGTTSPTPTAPAQPPTAQAGSAQTVNKGSTVTLDGSGSTDPGGHALTYAWAQTGGPAATLSSASSPKPTFTAPSVSGALTFSLVVNNGQLSSGASTVVITVQNRPPVAFAPGTLTVGSGSQVILDGSGSSDPDQDPLTYTWTQTSGTPVTLTSLAGGKASFVAPAGPDSLSFSLVVSDGEVTSAATVEVVGVSAPAVPVPPVVSAGPNITTPKRAWVGLTATVLHSSGAPLVFQWQQISGTSVTLQNANTANASFTAPTTTGDLVFGVTATDGTLTSTPSTVRVHVQNFPPSVTGVVLTPIAPKRNDPISVTANISDPDNDPLTTTYTWTRNGTTVAGATSTSYPLGKQVKGDVIGVTITCSDGELSTQATATTTIVDTPAVLTATPPTTAIYGTVISFRVTASDVDGDPTGPVELAYGPAGMSVDGTGMVSWTPSGPMFDRSVDVNWGVRLKNAPWISLQGTITVTDTTRKLPLVRSNPGIPVGNNSIEIADFDGSGVQQALVGTYESVYLLAKSGSDYQQTWVYPFDIATGSQITAVASGDVDGDGHREIFIAAGPIVVKLDGVTRRETGRFGSAGTGTTVAGPYCTALRYADIDNDGKGELVCLGLDSSVTFGSNSRIYVLDAATMQVKWQTADLNLGTSMAVGNVDHDAALEIVTNNGYVFDGATGQNKWVYGSSFGSAVDIGDVTGDGIGKIVGLSPGPAARVFDAVVKSPIWEIPSGSISGESALKVAELDGTAPAAIIVGDAQWGNVTAYRYSNATHATSVVAQVAVPGDGVSGIAVGDINNDGKTELVFGSDYYSSGRDYLTVAAWTPTPAALWSGPLPVQLDGPFYGAKLARITPTSQQLMFMSPHTDSGYGGTRVISMDPMTAAIGVSTQVDTNWSYDHGFDVGNVLGTGIDSMLIATAALYDDYFTAFDFASGTQSWKSGTLGFSAGGVAITHADLNNDGVDDLVGITATGYIYVYDVTHQVLLWSSTGLSGGGKDIAVADLDGDGVPEIIALTGEGVFVYARSGSTYLQRAYYSVTGTSLLVADTNGDGKPEVYALASNGNGGYGSGPPTIYQLDNNLNVLNSFTVGGATALFLEKSAFAHKNLVVANSNGSSPAITSALQVIDPSSGALIWSSPPLLGPVSPRSLEFYDFGGTGKVQLTFGTSTGMYVTQ